MRECKYLSIDHVKSQTQIFCEQMKKPFFFSSRKMLGRARDKNTLVCKSKIQKIKQNISEIFLQPQSCEDRWHNQSSGSIAANQIEDISKQLLFAT